MERGLGRVWCGQVTRLVACGKWQGRRERVESKEQELAVSLSGTCLNWLTSNGCFLSSNSPTLLMSLFLAAGMASDMCM